MLTDLLPYLAGLGTLIAAVFGARWKWRREGATEARQQTALEAAERYAKTRKEMDDAQAGMGDDPHILRDWLRERGKR